MYRLGLSRRTYHYHYHIVNLRELLQVEIVPLHPDLTASIMS